MPCSSPPHAELRPPEDGLVLREMRVSDMDQVLQIESTSFASPWKSEHFLHELRQNRWAVNLVVERCGVLVGYACVRCFHDELKINNIAIVDAERGRGIGRWLLLWVLGDAIARGCRSAALEVRPSNAAALALYRSRGFVEIGRRKGYYASEGEDAIVMSLELDPQAWKTIASAGGAGV
jgi:ribosomal-protein-alanine N-acetyltransferase